MNLRSPPLSPVVITAQNQNSRLMLPKTEPWYHNQQNPVISFDRTSPEHQVKSVSRPTDSLIQILNCTGWFIVSCRCCSYLYLTDTAI